MKRPGVAGAAPGSAVAMRPAQLFSAAPAQPPSMPGAAPSPAALPVTTPQAALRTTAAASAPLPAAGAQHSAAGGPASPPDSTAAAAAAPDAVRREAAGSPPTARWAAAPQQQHHQPSPQLPAAQQVAGMLRPQPRGASAPADTAWQLSSGADADPGPAAAAAPPAAASGDCAAVPVPMQPPAVAVAAGARAFCASPRCLGRILLRSSNRLSVCLQVCKQDLRYQRPIYLMPVCLLAAQVTQILKLSPAPSERCEKSCLLRSCSAFVPSQLIDPEPCRRNTICSACSGGGQSSSGCAGRGGGGACGGAGRHSGAAAGRRSPPVLFGSRASVRSWVRAQLSRPATALPPLCARAPGGGGGTCQVPWRSHAGCVAGHVMGQPPDAPLGRVPTLAVRRLRAASAAEPRQQPHSRRSRLRLLGDAVRAVCPEPSCATMPLTNRTPPAGVPHHPQHGTASRDRGYLAKSSPGS